MSGSPAARVIYVRPVREIPRIQVIPHNIHPALAAGLFFLLLYLVFSKYGRIPLGLDGEEAEYSIGAEFDSTSEQATEWYGRTDEGGVPIPYDYDAGECISKEKARDLVRAIVGVHSERDGAQQCERCSEHQHAGQHSRRATGP